MKINDFFKIAIIVLGCIFLYLYQQKSEMGRYQMEGAFFLDTKNGKVYMFNGNKFKEVPIDK